MSWCRAHIHFFSSLSSHLAFDWSKAWSRGAQTLRTREDDETVLADIKGCRLCEFSLMMRGQILSRWKRNKWERETNVETRNSNVLGLDAKKLSFLPVMTSMS
jgi:hypothetical protein